MKKIIFTLLLLLLAALPACASSSVGLGVGTGVGLGGGGVYVGGSSWADGSEPRVYLGAGSGMGGHSWGGVGIGLPVGALIGDDSGSVSEPVAPVVSAARPPS